MPYRTNEDRRSGSGSTFAADRLDHINNSVNGLKSKIDEGISVISDRFVLSNYAYQSVKAPLEWVMELNRISLDTLRPDCHIYIDVDLR